VAGEAAGQGLRGEGGGAGGEELENKRKKEAKHKQGSFQPKAKRRLWSRESVPRPRKAMRPKSSRMEKEWEVEGRAAKL
jgi:hypothetical protein